MNNSMLKLKHGILSTRVGQKLRDISHIRFYTMEKAKKASIEYYGDEHLAEDMRNEALKYEVTFPEYRMYHFENLSSEERRQYISLREGKKYIERLNSYQASYLFYSKAETYKHFKKYFKRDVLELNKYTDTEKNLLKDMATAHKRLIFKPYDGYAGMGIQIKDFEKESFEKIWNYVRENYKNGCVAEEVVSQHKKLDEIVAGVLCTVRISTIVYNDRVEIFETCWRCGRKGSIVDNGGSGGLVCWLNQEGQLVSAVAEDGTEYINHPDTGKRLIGFQIPEYDKALELAKELAMVCPDVRYVGWDLAITDQGWIMMEGNADASIAVKQISLHTGIRPELDSIMKELNL